MGTPPNLPQRPGQQRNPQFIRRTELFVGPLPSPEILQRYNEVHPGLAERIVNMTEEYGRHNRELASRSQAAMIRETTLGQVFAFIIALAFVGAGAYLIAEGHSIAGTLFSSGGLLPVVVAFIRGRGGHTAAPRENNKKPG